MTDAPSVPDDCGARLSAGAGSSSHELGQMWQRQLVWWHGLFGVILAMTLVVTAVDAGPHRGWRLAATATLGLAYAVWGRRGIGASDPTSARLYLGVAWLMMLVLTALDGTGAAWILTFALFPQTWASLPRNQAAGTVFAAVAGLAVARIWQGERTADDLIGVVISTGIMLVLSIALGLFISSIITEANTRATVIDELQRTQADLAVAERGRGMLAERERLSREIHDTLAQGFTSVVTLARAADSALSRGDVHAVRERLALLEQTAAENLAEARLIVAELSPGHLQSGTLAEALQRVVDRASHESGIAGVLTVTGVPVAATANSEVALLRTVQEALANIRRHSGASRFEVRLTYAEGDQIALEVTDDGAGFDPGAGTGGYGLVGAQARAADLGSELQVESAPGGGTTLRVSVPR